MRSVYVSQVYIIEHNFVVDWLFSHHGESLFDASNDTLGHRFLCSCCPGLLVGRCCCYKRPTVILGMDLTDPQSHTSVGGHPSM